MHTHKAIYQITSHQMDVLLLRIQRLLPAIRGGPSKHKACTLRLPAELIDIILHHLSLECVLCFALTCRALFVRYFPRPAPLSDTAKTTFLQYLERDHPRLYFCHDCIRLHTWRLTHTEYGMRVDSGPCLENPALPHHMSSHVAEYGDEPHVLPGTHSHEPTPLWLGPRPIRKRRGGDKLNTGRDFRNQHYALMERAKIINDSLYLHGRMVHQKSE